MDTTSNVQQEASSYSKNDFNILYDRANLQQETWDIAVFPGSHLTQDTLIIQYKTYKQYFHIFVNDYSNDTLHPSRIYVRILQ